MEIDGLGARCHLPTCRTLDFLPFRCPNCHNQFCREHQLPASHSCHNITQTSQIPVCPLCNSPVPTPANTTPDQAVSRHIDLGCPKRTRANPVCSKKNCSRREAVSTRCASCGGVFCLEHRLEMDHDCAGERRAVVGKNPFGQNVVGRNVLSGSGGAARSKAGRKARGDARTDFVNDMANAIGDPKVEEEYRIRVSVFFPMGSGLKPRYMYFNRRNSAGRIIDDLRKSIRELEAPKAGGRFCLYAVKGSGGGVNLLPHITPLKDLPPGVLSDGDALVLEEGDGGLDQTWLDTFRGLAGAGSQPTPRSLLPSKMLVGRRAGKGKSDRCAVS